MLVRTTYRLPASGTAATLLLLAALTGCGAENACPAAGPGGGVGITAVDGSTDAQGRADLSATVCLGETCRTVSLAAEPNQQQTLVAGFVDLPLTSTDPATVRVSVSRGGATTAGPFEVQVHPIGAGAPPQGCGAPSYVASVVIDGFGAHEAPPPQAPGRT